MTDYVYRNKNILNIIISCRKKLFLFKKVNLPLWASFNDFLKVNHFFNCLVRN